MALKATIFKADLNIADMDRDYYADHNLTIARHPSETDERMMVRLAAFARHAHERLQFTRGLSADDEADIWQRSLADEIEVWIDVGQPDERRVRKACNRAQRVLLYVYGGRGADLWWQQNEDKLKRFDNLTVFNLPKPETDELAAFAERGMRLQCTIQDGQLWINNGEQSVQLNPVLWKSGSE